MRTLLPEWAPQEAILMAMPSPDTDWLYILGEARQQYLTIIKSLTDEGVRVILLCKDKVEISEFLSSCDQRYLILLEADYNDTWTRDYGPIAIIKDDRLRALDFGFNGWGLKFASNKDNLVNLRLTERYVILPETYKNERSFVLEGGSIETDGEGTLLTTTKCLCSPNRNGGLTKAEAEKELRNRLGVSHVLFLDYGALEGDDTDSHIDTLARIAPENTILFTGCRNLDDPQFEDLIKMRAQLSMFRNAEGMPFNLIELPLPDAIFDENGERLPATYANYLITDSVVFVPTYNQPANDTLAMQTLKIAFPDHKVIGIDCRTLIKQHGSLHCATMQIPTNLFNPEVYVK
ncbi:MAG: agmatine deiminase family protein [Muribaculaceae bacterium]|nr:agmatine deiminase family protein [Muribaculaceae bacterium]